jgi:mannan endo-1,4-beta-mannosidase
MMVVAAFAISNLAIATRDDSPAAAQAVARVRRPTGLSSRAKLATEIRRAHAGAQARARRARALGHPKSIDSVPTIGALNGQLTLSGAPYKFIGVNAYELATDWGTNAGCGGMLSDSQLNDFFASLPPNSLVRFWAYQAMATNINTHQLDWGPIDRVFAAAAAHGQRLIVSLGGQGGVCDGEHWQDPSWYNGGFRDVSNSSANSDGVGLDPLSYWDYVKEIVNRYKNSPALGMWEPISEAEASTCPPQYEPIDCGGHQICPNEHAAALALRNFFDVVGGLIHRLDPTHLLEDGFLGGGQCGTAWTDYAYVSESPGIDVLSYHDYSPPKVALGGDQWNGVAMRLAQAAEVGKPVIAGEIGLVASVSGDGCPTLQARATEIKSKLHAQFARGLSGALIWNWGEGTTSTACTYDTYPGDPLISDLGQDIPH